MKKRRMIVLLGIVAVWAASYVGLRMSHILIHEEHYGASRCGISTPHTGQGLVYLKQEVDEHHIWPARNITAPGRRAALTVLYSPFGMTERLAWCLARPRGTLADSSMQTVLILRRLCEEYSQSQGIPKNQQDQWGNIILVKHSSNGIVAVSPGLDGTIGNRDDIEEDSERLQQVAALYN